MKSRLLYLTCSGRGGGSPSTPVCSPISEVKCPFTCTVLSGSLSQASKLPALRHCAPIKKTDWDICTNQRNCHYTPSLLCIGSVQFTMASKSVNAQECPHGSSVFLHVSLISAHKLRENSITGVGLRESPNSGKSTQL